MTEIQDVQKILAVRFARLGDVVLLLPALGQLKRLFPRASLSLMTGDRCAPIARLCPFLDEVLAVDRLAMRDGSKLATLFEIATLVRKLRRNRFDMVIDFHSFRETNLLSWISSAQYRVGLKRADRGYLPFCFNLPPIIEDKGIHVAKMFERVVNNISEAKAEQLLEGPLLCIPSDVRSRAETLIGVAKPRVGLYVGASVMERRWPSNRFAALADYVVSSWGVDVLILSGASEAEERIAKEVYELVRNYESVQVLNRLRVEELAAMIDSVSLMISNDSGPMHIGSALGVPTLGIFSLSLPVHYRPIGTHDRYIKKNLVDDIQVEEVTEIADQMWVTASPGHLP